MKKLTAYLILSAAVFSHAQTVESLGFNPAEIRPDDTSDYTLVIKGINASVDPSSIPMPSGLHIIGTSRSQSISLGSGGQHSEIRISYTVRADSTGTYTVPDWKIKYGSQIIDIAKATLVVSDTAPAQSRTSQNISGIDPFSMFGMPQHQYRTSRPQTHSTDDLLKKGAQLEIKIPREKIYIGESVQCELVFSIDKSLIENGFKIGALEPSIKKADAFDCPPINPKYTLDVNSDPSKVLFKYPVVITPLKVGNYDLDFSARGVLVRELSVDDLIGMSAIDRMLSMGSGRQIPFEVNMPARKVDVLPLPEEGKPAKFTGAIGSFSLENVTIDPDSLSVGEPCTISAKVVGMGNFSRISAPAVDCGDNWKSYKFKSSFVDESNGLGNIGIKTFECTVVPNKPDLTEAPTLIFNFFNPESGKYVELKSQKIEVSVAPSVRSKRAKELEEASKDPIFENSVSAKEAKAVRSPGVVNSPYFWGVQIVVLAALALFIVRRRNSLKLANNPAYAKALKARKDAEAYLKQAKSAAASGDAAKFFACARRAVQCALSADTELESEALLLRQAEDIMRSKAFPEEEISDASVFFESLDAMNYGALDPSKTNLAELSGKLSKIVRNSK